MGRCFPGPGRSYRRGGRAWTPRAGAVGQGGCSRAFDCGFCPHRRHLCLLGRWCMLNLWALGEKSSFIQLAGSLLLPLSVKSSLPRAGRHALGRGWLHAGGALRACDVTYGAVVATATEARRGLSAELVTAKGGRTLRPRAGRGTVSGLSPRGGHGTVSGLSAASHCEGGQDLHTQPRWRPAPSRTCLPARQTFQMLPGLADTEQCGSIRLLWPGDFYF